MTTTPTTKKVSTGQTVSIKWTPQAGDDTILLDEDYGADGGPTTDWDQYLLSNDGGGSAATLYGIYNLTEAQVQSQIATLQPGSASFVVNGVTVSLVNGNIEFSFDTEDYQHLGAGTEIEVGSFTYVIRMSNGTFSTATATIKIGGSNDAPDDISLDNSSINENEAGAVAGKLTTSDVDDGDTHTYAVDDDRFEVVDGELKLKNGVSLDFEAIQSLVVKVTTTDAGGKSFEKSFTINVADVNEAPDGGEDQVVSANEDATADDVLAKVSASEPDEGGGNDGANAFENLSYAIKGGSALFEINTSGEISLKAGQTLDFEAQAQHTLTIVVTDGGGLFDEVDVTINVADVNEAPEAGDPQTVSVIESVSDTTVIATVNATDPDLGGGNDDLNAFENLTYSLVDDFDLFEIDQNGNISLIAGASLDYEGPDKSYTLTVQVADGGSPSLTDTTTVTINVTNDTSDDSTPITVAPPTTGTGDPNDVPGSGYTVTKPGNDTSQNASAFTPANTTDVISALGGNDTVSAGGGNDTVFGGTGADNIDGGGGTDLIFGGSGADSLLGDVGNDTIYGGYGADTIDGGADSDVIVYLSALDTGDQILNFSSGADKLNFSQFNPDLDTVQFVSSLPTSSTLNANGITVFQDGEIARIYADTDGDTTDAEFYITVQGTVVASDIIL